MANYVIYNSDSNRLEHFDGANWQVVQTQDDINSILTQYLLADGTRAASQLLVGSGAQDPGSLLQMNSTTQGFKAPRMSETQRDLLPDEEGLFLYNLTTKKYNFNDGSQWVVLDVGAALPIVSGYTAGHAVYVEATDGAQATSLDLVANLTENTWVSVGPTGSGAPVIWTDLDVLPATAVAVILKTRTYAARTAVSSTSYVVLAAARSTGSSTATSDAHILAEARSFNNSGSFEEVVDVGNTSTVPINSSLRLDLLWDSLGTPSQSIAEVKVAGWLDSL